MTRLEISTQFGRSIVIMPVILSSENACTTATAITMSTGQEKYAIFRHGNSLPTESSHPPNWGKIPV